uniref:DNA damage-inducible protein 1 n=1 Tax=Hirondellea gigas TaxID=1518452 RepID=A0A6A7GC65_9CRUS
MVQITFTAMTRNGEKTSQFTMESTTSVEHVKVLIEAQFGISLRSLTLNNTQMANELTLEAIGVKTGDLIIAEPQMMGNVPMVPPSVAPGELSSLDQVPPHIANDPILFQRCIRENPKLLQQLLHQNPTLAEAVLSDDPLFIRSIFQNFAQQDAQRRAAQQERLARLHADPMNLELQREIEEAIRLENVEQNMKTAVEHMPESFGRVVMLYVPCEVNGRTLTAFVDSGAQSTIMSRACAERIGIMRLVDTRWSGMAKGVGTAKIIGRVHLAQIKIKNRVLNCSFTILEQDGMEFLFGLDMLRRHQICIDLKANCFRIGDDEVPFLSEKDIPRMDEDEEKFPSSSSSSSSSAPSPSSSSARSSLPQLAPSSSSAHPNSSPSSSVGAAPSSQSTQSADSPFPAESIKKLTDLGFDRQSAISALHSFQGNVEMAAALLFQSRF